MRLQARCGRYWLWCPAYSSSTSRRWGCPKINILPVTFGPTVRTQSAWGQAFARGRRRGICTTSIPEPAETAPTAAVTGPARPMIRTRDLSAWSRCRPARGRQRSSCHHPSMPPLPSPSLAPSPRYRCACNEDRMGRPAKVGGMSQPPQVASRRWRHGTYVPYGPNGSLDSMGHLRCRGGPWSLTAMAP